MGDIPYGLIIAIVLLIIIGFYGIVVVAVRRGIDSSKTSEMIRELLEKQQKDI